jgi:hypothetical protein
MSNKKVSGAVGLFFLLAFLFLSLWPARAEIPKLIGYQGYLTSAAGVPVNGPVKAVFSVYTAPSGGIALWSETQTVTVNQGVFEVILGAIQALTLPFDNQYYIGVEVENDGEMTPRKLLTSVGYAYQADNAGMLNRLPASSYSLAGHNHDAAYVNAAGDTMSGASGSAVLTVNNTGAGYGGQFSVSGTTAYGVSSLATGDSGIGVYGVSTGNTGYGMSGYGTGTAGTGVYGYANSSAAGTNRGGDFRAEGTNGQGVRGLATNTGNYLNYGGYFSAAGSQGRGVYGAAIAPGDVGNVGGYFEAAGNFGQGVHGETTGTYSYGMFGKSSGQFGIGVHGEGTGASAYGVDGLATGTNGRGVYGRATATGAVTNYGGFFEAAGDSGRGVYGSAQGVTGWGVSGHASGASGIGVHGNATGSSGYGLSGNASGAAGIGVYGNASYVGTAVNYGGLFESAGSAGAGVRGNATGISGQGVRGFAAGTDGQGVYGEASSRDGVGVYGAATYAGTGFNYGGYFVADAAAGRGVWAEATGSGGIAVYAKGPSSGDSSRAGVFTVPMYGGRVAVEVHAPYNDATAVWADGDQWGFYAYNGGYGPFTGGHEVILPGNFPADAKPGMIVSVTGENRKRIRENKTSVHSNLPTVALAKRPNDKNVFGVFVREAPLSQKHWYEKRDGERFATVNALGEGKVLVTNVNGNIECGDYITTSAIQGYGQKQDDDILRNYTLGKAIETVDWDEVTETVEFEGRLYKVYLIGVVYTSG